MMASSDNGSGNEEEPPESPLLPRRKSTRKRKKVDYSEDYVKVIPDKTTTTPSKKRRRGRAASGSKAAATTDNDKAAKKPPERAPKKRKGRKKASGGRDRGSVKSRTCPHCKRLFTSIMGRDYHVDHNVCRGDASKRQRGSKRGPSANATIFDTLKPGSKFVTPFGVVEVVSDTRAKSTAQRPSNASQLAKNFKSARHKVEARQRRKWTTLSVRNRSRRRQLGELYQRGEVKQATVFDVYFEGDPRTKASEGRVLSAPKPPSQDPLCPIESHPDRIVECLLVPDERDVHVDLVGREAEDCDNNNSDDDKSEISSASLPVSKPNSAPCSMKLLLQRRLLTEEYVESIDQFVCADCGRKFSSRPGYAYHAQGQVCVKKKAAQGEQSLQIHKDIEDRVDSLLTRSQEVSGKRGPLQRLTCYPHVWSSLGFLLPGSIPREVVEPSDDDSDSDVSDIPDPDVILHDLRTQLMKERNRLNGAMYPSVFESLGFQERGKRRAKKEPLAKKRRKRRKTAPPEMLPPKPLPPIIDVRVLADEIDAGRFPSIKRYQGEHVDECVICKEGGTLFCCDFCSNAVHLPCIRQKHTVKYPEPEDDFLCHKCIQHIMFMRSRAEKRRLKKREAAHSKNGFETAADIDEIAVQVSSAAVGESEYHKVASRAQELNELVELLRDAKSRLQESVRVTEVNEARRRLL